MTDGPIIPLDTAVYLLRCPSCTQAASAYLSPPASALDPMALAPMLELMFKKHRQHDLCVSCPALQLEPAELGACLAWLKAAQRDFFVNTDELRAIVNAYTAANPPAGTPWARVVCYSCDWTIAVGKLASEEEEKKLLLSAVVAHRRNDACACDRACTEAVAVEDAGLLGKRLVARNLRKKSPIPTPPVRISGRHGDPNLN